MKELKKLKRNEIILSLIVFIVIILVSIFTLPLELRLSTCIYYTFITLVYSKYLYDTNKKWNELINKIK
jgi:hypothetical protein